jgi:hypothetical protein
LQGVGIFAFAGTSLVGGMNLRLESKFTALYYHHPDVIGGRKGGVPSQNDDDAETPLDRFWTHVSFGKPHHFLQYHERDHLCFGQPL